MSRWGRLGRNRRSRARPISDFMAREEKGGRDALVAVGDRSSSERRRRILGAGGSRPRRRLDK